MMTPLFDKWTNLLRPAIGVTLVGLPLYLIVLIYFGGSPRTIDIGYQPRQPIPYSHALHAGDLGLDCRYCHSTVETAGMAALPPTATCMNCHHQIRKGGDGGRDKMLVDLKDAHGNLINEQGALVTTPVQINQNVLALWQSHATGTPIQWKKVHDLPDYVFFNHAVHVNAGVGCVSCHGRVDKMDVVWQYEPLNMAWCLDCHRNPEKFLRDTDQITNMSWTPPKGETQESYGRKLLEARAKAGRPINPPLSCSGCHR